MWDEVLLFLVPFQNFSHILCTQMSDSGPLGLLLSCLFVRRSVCSSVVNFNFSYIFWTVRDRDFKFDIPTPLMMPFQLTPRPMTLWPWFDLFLKIAISDCVAHVWNLDKNNAKKWRGIIDTGILIWGTKLLQQIRNLNYLPSKTVMHSWHTTFVLTLVCCIFMCHGP